MQIKGENYNGINWPLYERIKNARAFISDKDLKELRQKQLEIGVSSVKTVNYEPAKK